MRQDFRYSVHMMPNKSNWTLCVYTGRSNNCFLSWDRCWATVNTLRPVKMLKVQNFYKFKMTIKIKKSSRARRPEGDDLRKRWWWWEALSQLPVSKLQLPSNPALILPSPAPPSPLPPLPFPNLRYWVNWFQEMSILRNRLWHCCWHSALAC